jgi:anaphase-promoting complex subunit 1
MRYRGVVVPTSLFQDSSRARKTINHIAKDAAASATSEIDAVSGVELDLADFTDIRFGQDRRLEEVARMLCSSSIPSVKVAERPELKCVSLSCLSNWF